MVRVLGAAVGVDFGGVVFGVKDLEVLTVVLLDATAREERGRDADVMRTVCDEFLLKQAKLIEAQHETIDALRHATSKAVKTLAQLDQSYETTPAAQRHHPTTPSPQPRSKRTISTPGGGFAERAETSSNLSVQGGGGGGGGGVEQLPPGYHHPQHTALEAQVVSAGVDEVVMPARLKKGGGGGGGGQVQPADSPISDTLQSLIQFTQQSRSILNSPRR